jgi:hypothetical protein
LLRLAWLCLATGDEVFGLTPRLFRFAGDLMLVQNRIITNRTAENKGPRLRHGKSERTVEATGCAKIEAPLPNALPARPSRREGEDSGARGWCEVRSVVHVTHSSINFEWFEQETLSQGDTTALLRRLRYD